MVQLKILKSSEEITKSELNNYYEYFLAASTDTLAVINSKLELEKIIIQGNDNDAFICACTDINHFLDSLTLLEALIKNKRKIFLMILRAQK